MTCSSLTSVVTTWNRTPHPSNSSSRKEWVATTSCICISRRGMRGSVWRQCVVCPTTSTCESWRAISRRHGAAMAPQPAMRSGAISFSCRVTTGETSPSSSSKRASAPGKRSRFTVTEQQQLSTPASSCKRDKRALIPFHIRLNRKSQLLGKF